MADRKTLTFLLMDPPYESARSTTALRLVESALERGHRVRVFAYEGAVCVPSPKQQPHANSVHGTDVAQENHPVPHKWVAALMRKAAERGAALEWINCGLCVDERGAHEAVEGVRRGSPADFWGWVTSSDNTLVIPTR